MTKVAVTDYTFSSLDIETTILEPLGCEVSGRQCRTPAELVEHTAEADYVLTQFARVDAAVIAAMKRARLIVRYGIGVDNVDLDAARARNIPVCNVPDYCIDEVSTHTLAFVLALNRHLFGHVQHVAGCQWAGAPGGAPLRLEQLPS